MLEIAKYPAGELAGATRPIVEEAIRKATEGTSEGGGV